jgi:hypothetical protein
MQLDCTGTVLSADAGSRILAKTMTAREVLTGALIVLVGSPAVALLSTMRSFGWPAFLATTSCVALFWAALGLLSFGLSRRRYERAYRTILEQLAS